MSDQPAAEPKKAEPDAPKKGSKLIPLLIVVNLAATGFTAFKVMTTAPAHAEPPPPEHPKPISNEVVGPVIAMDPFVVNLDEPGTSRYLKLTIQLELIAPEAEAVITKNKQLIRDAILSHLSGLKHADTLGTAAKEKLREAVMDKITKIVGPNQVRRMFFQEFVVQ